MKVTFHTIDDLDTSTARERTEINNIWDGVIDKLVQDHAPSPSPSVLPRVNRVLGFWLSYSACIVGIAILLSEVVLATGGNLAGRNVVLVGTVLLGVAIGGVVVSLVRR